jgi:hypothetical protein
VVVPRAGLPETGEHTEILAMIPADLAQIVIDCFMRRFAPAADEPVN